jgi:hypothetical protein
MVSSCSFLLSPSPSLSILSFVPHPAFLTNATPEASYYDLGPYSRHISTTSADAQQWFNRGLIWCYGFNHEEAAECFEKACISDPHCAMTYWGLAYALGPNYNKPWEYFDEKDFAETVKRS